MNIPPMSKLVGSTNFPGVRVTSSAKSMTTCHNAMLSIVLLDSAPILFSGKMLKPVHQSYEGSGKRQQGNNYQQPRRRTEVVIQQVSYELFFFKQKTAYEMPK